MTTQNADAKAYYDGFSGHYDSRRHSGYHALIDELESGFVAVSPGDRVLEAGCGTGLILDRLRQAGARVTGIDLSAGMLSHAKRRQLPVAQASVDALPFPDATFDRACSFKVLAHVPPIRATLAELARVVRPGGLMVLEFYNRRSLRGARWRLKLLLGGERTGSGARETDLFTRYDDVDTVTSYLPPNTRVEAVVGSMIFTPAAVFMSVPGVSAILRALERRTSRSRVAQYAGFLTVVIRRL